MFQNLKNKMIDCGLIAIETEYNVEKEYPTLCATYKAWAKDSDLNCLKPSNFISYAISMGATDDQACTMAQMYIVDYIQFRRNVVDTMLDCIMTGQMAEYRIIRNSL